MLLMILFCNRGEAMKPKKSTAAFSSEKLRSYIQISIFTAIIAVCSFVTIPAPVPFTLQTLGVFAALTITGFKKGLASIILYIILGITGLPVFSGFSAGIGHLAGASGGYITGFIFIALCYGLFAHNSNASVLLKATGLFTGLVTCYLFGTLWYVAVYLKDLSFSAFGSAFLVCVVPFIIPDLIKLSVAVVIDRKTPKQIR